MVSLVTAHRRSHALTQTLLLEPRRRRRATGVRLRVREAAAATAGRLGLAATTRAAAAVRRGGAAGCGLWAELDADSAGAGGPSSGASFSIVSAVTSQLVLDRILAASVRDFS